MMMKMKNSSYEELLNRKLIRKQPSGFEPPSINQRLFDWQQSVTRWALKVGKAALFEDCGLGKTGQQLAWSDEVCRYTGGDVLILAPLAVSMQTKREGEKFGIHVNIAETQSDIVPGINITNYEKLGKFNPCHFSGVVLDESSILKSYMGKTKRQVVDAFCDTPFRLACSATPAPNDLMELLNHVEFLGIMRSAEALSVWFIADQTESGKYKLKGHAERDFWEWVASWAICMEHPSDIGYSGVGYILPPLHERDEIIPVNITSDDMTNGLLREVDMSATGFYKERSRTAAARAERCAELVRSTNEQYLVWCYTNEEADLLKFLIPEAVEVRGNDKPSDKERRALDFVDGKHRVLISKPSIFGYGLNFQSCRNSIFCGLDYSFEAYYQAVRRFYRFGQTRDVNVYRVMGSTEQHILDVIDRKAKQKQSMARSMAEAMKTIQTKNLSGRDFKISLPSSEIIVPSWLKSECV